MNVTSYVAEVSTQVSQISLLSIPGIIWSYYLQFLWYYEPDSWVARVAYGFRALSILIAFPLIFLALLDIASYGIARTLGIVDDVKASTSDKATVHSRQMPSILVSGSNSSVSDSDRERSFRRNRLNDAIASSSIDVSQPHTFFADSEESNFKLSGVDVFSPANSEPPSPSISRRNVQMESTSLATEQNNHDLRQRVR